MNVFAFQTYLEFVSPNDNVTVMRYSYKDIGELVNDTILYQFTYDDLAQPQKDILHLSEDKIAKRLLTNLPAREKETLRKLAVVTPAQLRLALLEIGVDLESIDTAIANIADIKQRKQAEILWNYANEVQRNHPLISSFGKTLGLSEEQIDDIFSLAKTIA